MKKIYLGLAIILACSGAQAQYKKASFLNKSGRTYDVGFTGRYLAENAGTIPGIYYSYGRDQGKRAFHWFDLEVLLPAKFKYNTVDKENDGTTVTVTGKSTLGLVYRYNFGYYLINTEKSESKIKPFVTAGINLILFGANVNSYEISPEDASPAKYIATGGNFKYGANAGIGGIYALSEKIGIKLTAGYNWQGTVNSVQSNYDEGYSPYKVISNHAYVGLGVRFVMTGED